MVCTTFAASPLDRVSFNLSSHVKRSIDEQDLQAVIVRTYEAGNDRRLNWSKILSPELSIHTLESGGAFPEKRHIVFWLQSGNAPLTERFSMALELPNQERSWKSNERGESFRTDPIVLQVNGYSNVVEFVSSLAKAKSKMDQWMELAFGKEITYLVKRIPSISYSLSDITDADVVHDSDFRPVSYSKIAGFNVHDAFFYTMIINAKPNLSERYPERYKFKPFLVLSTEKRYLKYVAEHLEFVKGKRIDQFGFSEQLHESRAIAIDPWGELEDGSCVLSEFTTMRIVADNTVLIPKTLISYDDVIKLIPLLNPNSAARELQQLRQQRSKDNSIRKRANDLFH